MSDIDRTFARVFEEMRADRTAVRSELAAVRTEMGALRTEMGTLRTEMGAFRSDVGADFAEVRSGLAELNGAVLALHQQLTGSVVKVGVAVVGLVGLGTAAVIAALFRSGF